ncbi:Polyketide cyclase / dehydrase and lipid transport [Mycolicibacterium chubuense NBB4]|uniref:Polyketide cyclase / dehydrase and lipid transport n=1 Tax=Mycolicibacterium chubuense (strain NBB4) TaxID=710421 RepID=I4BRH3_MYCCN|nr:SRPBCC family protein [Mycolicibacterium chubuense]AFM19880.1 Polyketide cyclase / dehydrase and lipid transport [Mycolicibacterium chubuense NBB4]
MRLQRSVIANVDRHIVWKHVSDPECYPTFMPHLERWETVTEGPVGIGSRYTVHWKVGSVPIGGVIELTEFDDARDLAWIGITGVTLRGRFRLRDCGEGKTKVTFRLSYEAPGSGILALIADRVAARQVGRIMDETVRRLKVLVEG